MKQHNIAVIGNAANTLISFRLDLIKQLVEEGHIVYAFSPGLSKEDKKIIWEAGAVPVDYQVSRAGINPLKEVQVIRELKSLFEKHNIDCTLSYFIKPVIYGSIAARLAKVEKINSMVAGLGFAFTHTQDETFNFKRWGVRLAIKGLFKIALSFNQTVFFQNPDDQAEFISMGLVDKEKTVRVYGSGVDVSEYQYSETTQESVTFLTMGRLLEEKGFREYYKAAKEIKKEYPDVRFLLLGGADENPSSLPVSEVEEWVSEGVIEWPGMVNNVGDWLIKSNVFVLASYREGTPRSTLEAMSCGRPVITTDVPGCRETVVEGENGFLIPPADAEALAKAMRKFIQYSEMTYTMGKESRRIAEEFYDVRKVNKVMIEEMGLNKIERLVNGRDEYLELEREISRVG